MTLVSRHQFVHQTRGCMRPFLYIVGVGFVIAALLTVVAALNEGATSAHVVLATFFTVIGSLILLFAYHMYKERSSDDGIEVHSDRLVVKDGRRHREVHWDNVESIVRVELSDTPDFSRRIGTSCLRIVDVNGKKIQIGGMGNEVIEDYDDFCTAVESAVSIRLLPKLIGRIEAGEKIKFGKVTISSEGLEIQRQLFRWDRIGPLRIEPIIRGADGYRTIYEWNLVIPKKDGLATAGVPFAKIANARLIMDLQVALMKRDPAPE